MNRRALVVSILAAAAPALLVGCAPLLRLLVPRGATSGLLRAARLGAPRGAFGRAAAGTSLGNTATAATLARPAAYTFHPAMTSSLQRGGSLKILERTLRSNHRVVGSVTRQNRITQLSDKNGDVYMTSAVESRVIRHFDFSGYDLGYSRFFDNATKAAHHARSGRPVGYDRILARAIRHFDHNEHFIGESSVDATHDPATGEWLASDDLIDTLEYYTASVVFCDEEINAIYQKFRASQKACLQGGLQHPSCKPYLHDLLLAHIERAAQCT